MEDGAAGEGPLPPILMSLQFVMDSSEESVALEVTVVVVVVEVVQEEEEEEEVDDDKGNDGEKDASPSALAGTGELVSGLVALLCEVLVVVVLQTLLDVGRVDDGDPGAENGVSVVMPLPLPVVKLSATRKV